MGCGIRPLPAPSGHWAREMRLEPWGQGGCPLPTRLGLAIAGARPEGQGISTPLPDGAHQPIVLEASSYSRPARSHPPPTPKEFESTTLPSHAASKQPGRWGVGRTPLCQ